MAFLIEEWAPCFVGEGTGQNVQACTLLCPGWQGQATQLSCLMEQGEASMGLGYECGRCYMGQGSGRMGGTFQLGVESRPVTFISSNHSPSTSMSP